MPAPVAHVSSSPAAGIHINTIVIVMVCCNDFPLTLTPPCPQLEQNPCAVTWALRGSTGSSATCRARAMGPLGNSLTYGDYSGKGYIRIPRCLQAYMYDSEVTCRPRVAVELHVLQCSIVRSAFGMLKPGGRLVYSTCSLNPFENEAVVATVLSELGSRARLVDLRDGSGAEGVWNPLMHGLRARPGLSQWRCDDDVLFAGESPEDRRTSAAMLSSRPDTLRCPAEDSAIASQLQRCLRLYPQDQNTGGFFVAVFELLLDTLGRVERGIGVRKMENGKGVNREIMSFYSGKQQKKKALSKLRNRKSPDTGSRYTNIANDCTRP